MRLTLGVVAQALTSPATQGIMQNKIQTEQIGQFIPFDRSSDNIPEVPFHLLAGDLFFYDLESRRIIGDQTDVGAIPFIPGSSVCEVSQSYFSHD